ncbi:alpha-amylase [Streptomyces sp. NPDC006193]|uniref:alpha-amylase n=1 Tax=Streptomyces sp. NPDC006193 TaxID=3155717 RepID=UPI0033B87A03
MVVRRKAVPRSRGDRALVWLGRVAAAVLPLTAGAPVAAAPLTAGTTAEATAEAAPLAAEPAPECVALHESWRYTTVENTCPEALGLAVVYQDGATGPCSTVPPGAFTTLGEGYLGRHGRADHAALCPPS